MSFALKTVRTKRILYVMAASPEYGPHLKARITPLMTGVGPVEAAVQLTLALCHLAADGDLPDYVVSLGSAGSATLEQTEIYQAASVSYRDMDASPLGFTRGATPFLDLPAEVPLSCIIPGIPAARLSTGANIVSGAAYAGIDADMVEMETFGALRACQAFDVALIGLRGISDGKAELTHIGNWTEYLHIIDEKLAAAIDTLEAAVASGTIVRNG
ncbi:5'-methylthioadenosine/S-adenosylhomocysteine nucleosidase [Shinella sp. M27]|uniref:5'-methylthioadenosine/S-adenosylhomocysteine nucleosidase n=1 Tax=Shinella sp. M27 TaxID=3368614 RepID=UPI003B9E56F0